MLAVPGSLKEVTMPIKYVKHYTPTDCRENPDWFYVFGDNFSRYGKAGQAIIRDEPNAIGLATKRWPGRKDNAYLNDSDLNRWLKENGQAKHLIDSHLESGRIVVFPEDGLGTGFAQLHLRAPRIFEELQVWMRVWDAKYGW